ncbi:MAG: YqjD family protein [Paracoccaceae bacterium]
MAEPTKEELQAQLAAVRQDVRVLAAMAGARAGAEFETARSDAQRRLDALSEETRRLLSETGAEARARGEAAYADAETMLRRNPFASVGIAFGLGYLIGQIVRK